MKGLSKEGCKQYLKGWEDQCLDAWNLPYSADLAIVEDEESGDV